MKQSKSTAAVSLFAVFVCGIVVGVFGHRVYAVKTVNATLRAAPQSPEEWRRQYMSEMTERLKLDTAQVSKVNSILDETRVKMEALKASGNSERKAIYDLQVAQIESLLEDSQKREYAKIREERRQKRLEREKREGGSR